MEEVPADREIRIPITRSSDKRTRDVARPDGQPGGAADGKCRECGFIEIPQCALVVCVHDGLIGDDWLGARKLEAGVEIAVLEVLKGGRGTDLIPKWC